MNASRETTPVALVIIDLQQGILDPDPVPFGKKQIVLRAAQLGHAFAQRTLPIVVTTTDFAAGFAALVPQN